MDLDKSIINSIRRTLISEIPCVAFRVEEGTPKDLIMEVNNTSLHNTLLHRLSMIPLYINPETYENQYLFYLNVKHESAHPFRFVTTDDIQICFPLKEGIDVSDSIDIDNYDMKKPLSKQEHKDIFRPFKFKGKEYPILITELKATDTDGISQELICYGRPLWRLMDVNT